MAARFALRSAAGRPRARSRAACAATPPRDRRTLRPRASRARARRRRPRPPSCACPSRPARPSLGADEAHARPRAGGEPRAKPKGPPLQVAVGCQPQGGARRPGKATTSTRSSSTPTSRARSTRSTPSRCASPTSRSSRARRSSASPPRATSCGGFSPSANRCRAASSSGTSTSSPRGPISTPISPSIPTGEATCSSSTATPTRTWRPSSGTTPRTSSRGCRRRPPSSRAKRRAPRPVVGVDALNFEYTIQVVKGAPAWTPVQCFDDGRRTFVRFPSAMVLREAPALFVLRDAETQLVNYRVKGDTYVIDRLIDAAELRVGQKEQEIVRICADHGRGAAPCAACPHGQGLMTTAASQTAPSEAALDPHAPKLAPDDPRLGVGRPRGRTLRAGPIAALLASLLGAGVLAITLAFHPPQPKTQAGAEPTAAPPPPAIPDTIKNAQPRRAPVLAPPDAGLGERAMRWRARRGPRRARGTRGRFEGRAARASSSSRRPPRRRSGPGRSRPLAAPPSRSPRRVRSDADGICRSRTFRSTRARFSVGRGRPHSRLSATGARACAQSLRDSRPAASFPPYSSPPSIATFPGPSSRRCESTSTTRSRAITCSCPRAAAFSPNTTRWSRGARSGSFSAGTVSSCRTATR